MIIRRYTKRELMAWLDTNEHLKSNIHPISTARLISHLNNPFADLDDVLLVVAHNEYAQVLAYAGMMPDVAPDGRKFAWNSNWYSADGNGNVALRVLLEAMTSYSCVVFHDLTPHTLNILGTFKRHLHFHAFPGYRYWISPVNYKSFNTLVGRHLHNVYTALVALIAGRRKKYIVNESIDTPFIHSFLKDHHGISFLRSPQAWNWVLRFPWLSSEHDANYAFSSLGKINHRFITIENEGRVVGLAWVSLKGNQASVPYFIADVGFEKQLASSVANYLVHSGCGSLTTYNPTLFRNLNWIHFPYIKKSKRIKTFAVTKNANFPIDLLQDGDGDVVFT